MKFLKEQKGITLVTLVITMILLVILSAITINAIAGEGGIFKQSEKIKDTSLNSIQSGEEEMNSVSEEFANVLVEDKTKPIE